MLEMSITTNHSGKAQGVRGLFQEVDKR